MVNVADVLVWSADVPRFEIVTETLEAFPEQIVAKIDRLGQKKMGSDAVARLSALGIRVFDDAKIVEIPEKMEELAELHCQDRPWMLNCMAGGISSALFQDEDKNHRDGLKRFADVCHRYDVLPCGVTVLTSKVDDPDEPEKSVVKREFNGRSSVEQALVYTEWLIEAGFTDLVCSTSELPALSAEGFLVKINANVPGIRLPESDKQDQARVGTPGGALKAGAKRIVIGRDLTNNPLENYRRIEANIQAEVS